MTDVLKCIAENTAKYAGGGYIKARYADIIEPQEQIEQEDKRTCKEVVSDMWTNIRRKAVNNGN